jgi:hypothetical protein
MTKERPTQHSTGPAAARREARSERLAAALKANLRRRKAQARQRADAPDPDTAAPSQPPGSHDSAGIVDDKRSR